MIALVCGYSDTIYTLKLVLYSNNNILLTIYLTFNKGIPLVFSDSLLKHTCNVRPEKFQFMEKWQNRNFDYKIVISVKNP